MSVLHFSGGTPVTEDSGPEEGSSYTLDHEAVCSVKSQGKTCGSGLAGVCEAREGQDGISPVTQQEGAGFRSSWWCVFTFTPHTQCQEHLATSDC